MVLKYFLLHKTLLQICSEGTSRVCGRSLTRASRCFLLYAWDEEWPLNHSNALYLGILFRQDLLRWIFLYMLQLQLWTVLFSPSTSFWSSSPLDRVMGADLHLLNFSPIGTLKVKFGWKRLTVFGEKVKTFIIHFSSDIYNRLSSCAFI